MPLKNKYLKLYIGCKTNKGELTGICKNLLFIKFENENVETFTIEDVGKNIFLYLRSMNQLTSEEVKSLIEKGINIGRPRGYSFSSGAFLFLLDLHIDIFGLIEAGYAKLAE